jgi:hypothetical protein
MTEFGAWECLTGVDHKHAYTFKILHTLYILIVTRVITNSYSILKYNVTNSTEFVTLYFSIGLLVLQASAAMLINATLFWDITQCRIVILYRRFGTTCLSHLQESRSPRIKERVCYIVLQYSVRVGDNTCIYTLYVGCCLIKHGDDAKRGWYIRRNRRYVLSYL